VTTLAQRCTQMNGSLVLVDDEPWYYYFVGYYARFVCV
jgi:hypothetical protein